MVTSRRIVVVAVVAVLLVCAATGYFLFVKNPRPGTAIQAGMAEGFYGQPIVVGDRTYLLAPVIRNKSRTAVTLKALQPYDAPDGLQFVNVRAYEVADFGGAALTGWNSSIEGAMKADDPAERPSKPVIGTTIEPGKTLVDERQGFVLLQLEATRTGTLRIPCLEAEYEQDGRSYTQAIGGVYELRTYSSLNQLKTTEDRRLSQGTYEPVELPCPHRKTESNP